GSLSPGGGSGGGTPSTGIPGGTTAGGGTGVPGNTGVTGTPNTTSPTGGGTGGTGGYHLASSTPGLPPLGSVPGMLLIGGLILAAGLGWFFRAAALSALGAGSTCPHGLANGLPDLRKA
ncbi:MAG TPA: hypothetical protein VN108_09425, partial [Marmoricola sp.]|nr:hypothetical protein [Marmoricola sp.]